MTTSPDPQASAADGRGWRSAGAGLRRFVSRDEEERAWLLDMHRRLVPYSRISIAMLLGTIVLCLPWYRLVVLVPMVLAAVVFAIGLRLVERRRHVQPLVLAWFVTQALVAVAVTVNGDDPVSDLPILIFAVVGAGGRFPTRVVVACTVYTAALMVVVGLGFDGAVVAHDPPRLLVPLGLLVSVQVLAGAVRQASIEHRATSVVDALTGSLNRNALGARGAELEQTSRWSDEPVSTVMIDIDHFKAINDEHGHARGDAVLSGFAHLLRTQLRASDSAYRVGGEEFLLLAPGLTHPDAVRLAERVRLAVRGDEIDGVGLTASFGVATSDAGRPFALTATLAAADAALYEAKRGGRDRVVGCLRPTPGTIAAMTPSRAG